MKKTNKLFLYIFFLGVCLIATAGFLNRINSVDGEVTLRLNASSNIVTNPKAYQLTIQTKDKTKSISTSKLKRDFNLSHFPQFTIDDIIPEAYLDYRIFNKKGLAINPAVNLNVNGKNIWLLKDPNYPEFNTTAIIDGVQFALSDSQIDLSIPTYLIKYQDGLWSLEDKAKTVNLTLNEKQQFSIKEFKQPLLVKHLVSHAKVNQVAIPKEGGSPAVALYDKRSKNVTWISKDYPFQINNDELAYIHNKDFLLPFRLSLKDFKLNQDGTPKATLEVIDNYKKHNYNVYLNNPLEYRGYSIMLSAFNTKNRSLALFKVSKDPYLFLIYCGAAIILLAILTMFCNGTGKD